MIGPTRLQFHKLKSATMLRTPTPRCRVWSLAFRFMWVSNAEYLGFNAMGLGGGLKNMLFYILPSVLLDKP